jgi:hypothetical protein
VRYRKPTKGKEYEQTKTHGERGWDLMLMHFGGIYISRLIQIPTVVRCLHADLLYILQNLFITAKHFKSEHEHEIEKCQGLPANASA